MDSFYDQPRNVPQPTNINKLTGSLIPEISIIQPPTTNPGQVIRHPPPSVGSYNVWKARNLPSDQQRYNKENFNPNFVNRQFSDPSARKHVRFESPTLQRSNSSPPQNLNSRKDDQSKNMRPLEEIYLANIPNRHLDLSVLELPVNKKSVVNNNFNSETSDNYNDNVYDIYNYKRDLKSKQDLTKTYAEFKKQMNDDTIQKQLNEPLYSRNLCNELTNNDWQLSTKRQNDNEPTTRDLLKVIQQQNEQILLLQKQVACLLETKSNHKQIDNGDVNPSYSNTPVDQEKYKKLKKGPLSKIAIDVMTSFEVSFRPQNQNLQRNKLKEIDDSPKIEEINDSMSDVNNVLDGIKKSDKFDVRNDISLSLQEPLKVVERCPSPEQSIHVDMQDYSSDEEDADSDLGWTLYNNIMGQVNNIFKNVQNESPQQGDSSGNSDRVKDKTLRRVKDATIKHLKSIGINLPLIEENDLSKEDIKSNDECNSSDVSFAVKQLLMKYLPDEQLAKLQTNQMKPSENLIKRRPEFSFATVQYMKKYNLLASDGAKGHLPVKPQINSQKILDVTALKQQPKLL